MTTVLLVLAVLLPYQTTPAGMTGTWVAELKGTTFMRLELRSVDGRLEGGLGIGSFKVDANGVVNEAEGVPATLMPLTNFAVKDGVLSFTRDEDERFEVRLAADGQAQLTILLSDEDIEEFKEARLPVPKPIALRKTR